MSKFQLTYKLFGESALLIEWPSMISEAILKDITAYKKRIEQSFELQDIIAGYNSLLLVYHFKIQNSNNKIATLKKCYTQQYKNEKSNSTHWKIPVCYDKKFGVDLEFISKSKALKESEIIKIHSENVYRVYFIGFLPGFLYLGGLDERIAIPRKSTPRLTVSKGAVAIGGNQTGVYPSKSSGGWNIIGNSPISFFDIQKEQPCFAKAGDSISFESISLEAYHAIENEIKNNTYQIPKLK